MPDASQVPEAKADGLKVYLLPSLGYAIVAKAQQASVEFDLYAITGYEEKAPPEMDLYSPEFNLYLGMPGNPIDQRQPHGMVFEAGDNHCTVVETIKEAMPEWTGHVKWDGCSNFIITGENYIHNCDREGLVKIGLALAKCYDISVALLDPKHPNNQGVQNG
jgi:hypothetical protein